MSQWGRTSKERVLASKSCRDLMLVTPTLKPLGFLGSESLPVLECRYHKRKGRVFSNDRPCYQHSAGNNAELYSTSGPPEITTGMIGVGQGSATTSIRDSVPTICLVRYLFPIAMVAASSVNGCFDTDRTVANRNLESPDARSGSEPAWVWAASTFVWVLLSGL